jgi:hypothetical protein
VGGVGAMYNHILLVVMAKSFDINLVYIMPC